MPEKALNFWKINFLEGNNALQYRRKDKMAGQLAEKLKECVGIC